MKASFEHPWRARLWTGPPSSSSRGYELEDGMPSGDALACDGEAEWQHYVRESELALPGNAGEARRTFTLVRTAAGPDGRPRGAARAYVCRPRGG